MPYEIIWEAHGVIQRHWGAVNPSEFDEFNARFYGDARSDDCKYILGDFLEVTEVGLSSMDLQIVAGYDIGASKSIPGLKVALVAQSDEVIAACTAYREVMARSNTDWKVGMFQSIADARVWIK